jgi:cob(I)alamin adenosyltransferase
MQESESIPELAIIYLNRLSDLLFTLARLAGKLGSAPEETW